MKKNKIALFLTAMLLITALAGCGSAKTDSSAGSGGSASGTSETPSEASSSSSSASSSAGTAEDTDWLPSGVEKVAPEAKPNADLAKAITDYYQIPKEYLAQTKYQYNYVDLNGDGTDEILAVVSGPYTSGTGGDSMLWLLPNAHMAVNQAFTLVSTPIIVTKDALNGQEYGAKGLILMRSGGGAAAEAVLLKCTDGTYTQISSAEPVKDLNAIKGTAILCGDSADGAQGGFSLDAAE